MATLRSRTKFNLSLVTLTLRLRRPSPARMCRRKRPQGAQSHAERRVRPDAQADAWGLGNPNKRAGISQKDIPAHCLPTLSEISDIAGFSAFPSTLS